MLSRYGSVEFLIKFGEFLSQKKMSDLQIECQNIVKLLLRRKADDIQFTSVRNEMKQIIEGRRK